MSTTSDSPPPGPPVDYTPTQEEMDSPGSTIMRLFTEELIRRLKDPVQRAEMKAADFEMIRKLSLDNSVTFSNIKRGNLGAFAQKVAESFPFPGEDEGGNSLLNVN